MDHLRRAMRDVVRPMTATTKGLILLLTTPPNQPDHESQQIYDDLHEQGLTFDVTLKDARNPKLDVAEKAAMLKDAGEYEEDIPRILAGEIPPRTTTAQREYWCTWVSDAGKLVIPEYPEAAIEIVTDPGPPPVYRDCYVGADWGIKDPSAVLFSYWDSRRQVLVIEDEWLQRQAGTPTIAAAIHEKERQLWRGNFDVYRVCDIDLRLQRDLAELHDLTFALADKKDRAANVDLTRSYFRRKQIIIDPRCKKLDTQLHRATHDRSGKDFERKREKDGGEPVHPDQDMGHYDLVAALIYLVRFVHTRRKVDPYPDIYPASGPNDHVPLAHPSRQPPRRRFGLDTPTNRRLFGKKR
jgi:hypothetical protein